MTLYF